MLDLAVGSTLALSGLSAVFFYKATGLLVPSLFVGVFVGLFVSLITGLTVTKYKIPPFIATLGMLTAVRGVALLSFNGQNIYQIGDFDLGTKFCPRASNPCLVHDRCVDTHLVYAQPHQVWSLSLCDWRKRRSGEGVWYQNRRCKDQGLPGVWRLYRTCRRPVHGARQYGPSNSGIQFELDTLSIAVIGGTSITGGVGSATGTLAGAFIIGFISNIMNLMAVPSYIQQIVKGVIIVVAVGYDIASKVKESGPEESSGKESLNSEKQPTVS